MAAAAAVAAAPAPAAAAAAVELDEKEKARRAKFEPVYEALDAHNYSRVVLLCDKKEVAAQPLAKALKGVAYGRSGYRDEALRLVEEVMRGRPTDMLTIAAVVTLLRDAKEQAKLIGFLDASAAVVTDAAGQEELHKELYLAHLRAEDWKAMQLVRATIVWQRPPQLHSPPHHPLPPPTAPPPPPPRRQ